MKFFISIVVFCLCSHISFTQKSNEIGLRFGHTLHKMNIEETDNGFFFLPEQELIPYYEIYLKQRFKHFDLEVGLGNLDIRQLLRSDYTNENLEFPIQSASGEVFTYIAFPIRLKKEYRINSWIGFSPGVELTSAYLFDSMIFALESRSCTILNNIRSCRTLRLHKKSPFTTGLGLNCELNIKIMDRVGLGIFGFRNWRIGKGWIVDITREYEDMSGNIIESYQGTGRPSLSTWNMGISISFLW